MSSRNFFLSSRDEDEVGIQGWRRRSDWPPSPDGFEPPREEEEDDWLADLEVVGVNSSKQPVGAGKATGKKGGKKGGDDEDIKGGGPDSRVHPEPATPQYSIHYETAVHPIPQS